MQFKIVVVNERSQDAQSMGYFSGKCDYMVVIPSQGEQMETEVQVGKYTLESLTTGMYSDPKIVYREYIQNNAEEVIDEIISGFSS